MVCKAGDVLGATGEGGSKVIVVIQQRLWGDLTNRRSQVVFWHHRSVRRAGLKVTTFYVFG
jgi:hypothetical protein